MEGDESRTHSPLAENPTVVELRSDRELVVTRVFHAPPKLVYEAWTTPDLFKRWWTPKSSGMILLSCRMDVRVGGSYRLEFGRPNSNITMSFFGSYLEVVPTSRLVWTNEEGTDGAVTTVTFTEQEGNTILVLSELYPTRVALDASFQGMEEGMPEQFGQLDDLLSELLRGVAAE